MEQLQQQLTLALQELRVATDDFLTKRRKVVDPKRLRYSLHALILLMPFGAIMVWQVERLSHGPLGTFCLYLLTTFFLGVYASLYVVQRTAVGKQLDALESGDYQEFPELQQALHELRLKNGRVKELTEKLKRSSYETAK
jgi:hypothetical protein